MDGESIPQPVWAHCMHLSRLWADPSSEPVPVTFTCGFDVSRFADKTEFMERGIQTLTIVMTPLVEGYSLVCYDLLSG